MILLKYSNNPPKVVKLHLRSQIMLLVGSFDPFKAQSKLKLTKVEFMSVNSTHDQAA